MKRGTEWKVWPFLYPPPPRVDGAAEQCWKITVCAGKGEKEWLSRKVQNPEIKLSERQCDKKWFHDHSMLSQGSEMERHAPGNSGRFCWNGWRNLLLPQLNRQSLYVYGSEVAVEKECIRQREKGVFVIHPFSALRSYYIMCMVAITFLNLIGIPIEIAFLDGNSGVGWEGFNVFSDTLFLIDVGLNFRMGIISEDSEAAILDLKCIRQNYLKSWFIPDVIAAFPVGYILLIADLQYHSDSPSSKASKMVRILMFVRIISLVRLLRVSRLVRFFNEVEKVSNANLEVVRVFFRILSLFMMIFLLCHWNGCVQYFVPMLEEFPLDCWVRREKLMNATVGEKYSFGVFRALSHMTAISYGSSDTPTNEVELWIVMTSIVSGALMYTVLVANTVALMSDADITARLYKCKMNDLEDYLTFIKVPKALRLRISNYFQARYGGKWYDEKDVLKWVSSSLREEILMIMCSSLIRKVPIFRNCDVNFINDILLKLQFEVFQEGDIIMHQNAPGDRMFFIEHGQVVVETESLQKELCDGDYFGEAFLLRKGKCQATVQAQTLCHLFSLSMDSFYHVLEDYPELVIDLQKTIQQCISFV